MNASQEESDRYHREYYCAHELFQPGTWIEKPNSALMAIGEKLTGRQKVTVLDLGSGVGRNAIPCAQLLSRTTTTIDCVDILDVAIEKLKDNASRYQVAHIINPILGSVAEFFISPAKYDLVMAMSVLEHAVQSDQFEAMIKRIQAGTKVEGFNCLSIATNLSEKECATGKSITPYINTAISSQGCEALLRDLYQDWEIQKLDFSNFSQRLQREQQVVDWSADYCLFVAKRLG
jgi:2-polyprenyl-3-methyl-5-hydroxy-6-metoxy-1,4-benzoquinol methylase